MLSEKLTFADNHGMVVLAVVAVLDVMTEVHTALLVTLVVSSGC